MKMGKYCTKCSKRGEKKKLKPFLINFDEAVLLCINDECNNSDTFQVVGHHKLVFIPKSRRKKVNAGTTPANKSSEIPNDNNVGYPNEIKTMENVVVKSVDKELDEVLFGLTNNSDPATLDNDDLEFLGFDDSSLTQPVKKTAEVVISENFEDFGLGHNVFSNVQTQVVEKAPNEAFSLKNLDLRLENVPPSSDKVEKASKEVDELNHVENIGLENNVLSSIQTKPVEKALKEAFKPDDPHFLTFEDIVSSKTTNASVEKTSEECFRYPLWKNENNLCWLHAMMCVLVHNNSIRNYIFGCMRETFLNKLILGYDECVALLNSVGTNPELISETLKSLRDQLFTLLKPKMKRNLGECDNPWFVLWALVSREKVFGSLFDFKHRWETVCQCCGHKKVEKKRKTLQTFTKISDSFSLPNNPSTIVACVKCKKQKQTRCLKFEDFPSVLAFHFEQGIPLPSDIASLDFKNDDAFYKVSAVIQYKRNPNHFVTWIRDISSEKLLCCDDLNSLYTSFKQNIVDFKNNEVHVVFWDKTNPASPKENTMTQCSVTSTGVTEKTDKLSLPSPFWFCNPNAGSWVDEDISLKNWDCSSSSYSNHSNSTAPITHSRATTPNSLKSFASTNDSLATQPSQKRRKTAGQKAQKETGKSTQPRLRKGPTSSISDMSNPSDGDLSIVSVIQSSKCEGYQGYRPKTLPITLPPKPRIINRSPKRPKYDKGKSKKCKSPKEVSKKSNSSAMNDEPPNKKIKNESQRKESNNSKSSTKPKESSFDDTISNLLNDTNFFAL